MSGLGVEKDLVLNVTIWLLIYPKSGNQPSILWHISDPREDLSPTGSFGGPPGAPKGKWPSQCTSRDKEISKHENWPSSLQDLSWTNLVKLGLLSWAQWAIFYTLLKTVPMILKKVSGESSTKYKKTWPLTFFIPIQGQKGSKHMAKWGAKIIHTFQSNSSELKSNFYVNPVETVPEKTYICIFHDFLVTWNHFLWKTRNHLSYIINIMAVKDLAMEGPMASAATVLP